MLKNDVCIGWYFDVLGGFVMLNMIKNLLFMIFL